MFLVLLAAQPSCSEELSPSLVFILVGAGIGKGELKAATENLGSVSGCAAEGGAVFAPVGTFVSAPVAQVSVGFWIFPQT